ncbi:DUF4863 family protein [Oricola nitratireducens]|uniref:4-hydroxylaminobenzoate lyase n=1 Tax=Oricola nitratireducens TaxID=2775868 RepID=UPI0018676B85|nr:DUF4863 family protein [Oricola nitratireducens]
MSKQQFLETVTTIADRIGERPLDEKLAAFLNTEFPVDGAVFGDLKTLCAEGEAEGWLMAREAGGIKFGRAVKPGAEARSFSVDVVRMKDVKGPHHVHTTGEIGAIMTISGEPKFDGLAEGWYVYGPGSDHHPTVEGGDAYVLYLLPDGAIEFTGR